MVCGVGRELRFQILPNVSRMRPMNSFSEVDQAVNLAEIIFRRQDRLNNILVRRFSRGQEGDCAPEAASIRFLRIRFRGLFGCDCEVFHEASGKQQVPLDLRTAVVLQGLYLVRRY